MSKIGPNARTRMKKKKTFFLLLLQFPLIINKLVECDYVANVLIYEKFVL